MRYLISFLVVIGLVGIFLMPAWISWVPKTLWSLPIKRVTIITMATISMAFTFVVIIKPNPDLNTRIISSFVAISYLLIVFAVTYYSWIKLR